MAKNKINVIGIYLCLDLLIAFQIVNKCSFNVHYRWITQKEKRNKKDIMNHDEWWWLMCAFLTLHEYMLVLNKLINGYGISFQIIRKGKTFLFRFRPSNNGISDTTSWEET